MEIYNSNQTEKYKEFEKLLNNQSSKLKIEEGKITEGKISKITEKYVFLFIENLKSEPVLDINELKSIGLSNEKLKIGQKIPVLIEKLEDKNGECIVSASKAQKIKGWDVLVEAYEKNEPIIGKVKSKCKGGFVVEHIDTGSLMFCPGSQIADKPLKNIDHLINEPQKFALIKLDKIRGNACVSRRQIITNIKKEDKAKIIEKYKVGDIIKNAIVKGYSSFGVFFDVNSELDVLVHLQEISYSRVNHPEEIFSIGDKHNLLVISVDKEKQQVGCSIKQLLTDPFEHITNYELGKPYKFKIQKLMDYGAFCELEPGLISLLHSSELSWTKKNPSIKKIYKIGDTVECVITEIDKEKRRILISHKLTLKNPYEELPPVGSEIESVVSNTKDYALYVTLDNLEIDAFLHCNDLTYLGNPEEELKKYKKGDKLKVKILEIKKDQQKIRVGLRQTKPDPFDWFKGKKVNDIITVKVIKSDNKTLSVNPENSELEFNIKKSQIAVNQEDQRTSRWVGGERIDVAISELDIGKRKASLSIKLLEEIQNREAVSKFSSPLSGKNLPFSSLSDKLTDKEIKKKNK